MTTENTTSVVSKLFTIFGIGAEVTATRSKGKVVYTDGKTKLELAPVEGDTNEAGTYDVTIKSATDMTEIKRATPAVESHAEPKATTTAGRNSSSTGFSTRMPR